MYLLHGIGGDETEWIRFATPDAPLRQPDRRQSGGADDLRTLLPGRRTQASNLNDGGTVAAWARDGRRLFYQTADQRIWLSTGASATAYRSPLSPVSGQTQGSPTSVCSASMLETAGLRR